MIRTRSLSTCILVFFITALLAITACTAAEPLTFLESDTGSSPTTEEFTDVESYQRDMQSTYSEFLLLFEPWELQEYGYQDHAFWLNAASNSDESAP